MTGTLIGKINGVAGMIGMLIIAIGLTTGRMITGIITIVTGTNTGIGIVIDPLRIAGKQLSTFALLC